MLEIPGKAAVPAPSVARCWNRRVEEDGGRPVRTLRAIGRLLGLRDAAASLPRLYLRLEGGSGTLGPVPARPAWGRC